MAAWLALSVQVPIVSTVMVVPFVPPAVHIAVVALVMITGDVDAPAVALTVKVPTVGVVGGVG